MPAPAAAVSLGDPMDPTDRVEYFCDFADLLEQNEKIASANITLYPEAAALGFTILSGAGLAAAIVNDEAIRIWVEVASNMRENVAFSAGAIMPVEFTIETDANPFRRYNRTGTIRVVQL